MNCHVGLLHQSLAFYLSIFLSRSFRDSYGLLDHVLILAKNAKYLVHCCSHLAPAPSAGNPVEANGFLRATAAGPPSLENNRFNPISYYNMKYFITPASKVGSGCWFRCGIDGWSPVWTRMFFSRVNSSCKRSTVFLSSSSLCRSCSSEARIRSRFSIWLGKRSAGLTAPEIVIRNIKVLKLSIT